MNNLMKQIIVAVICIIPNGCQNTPDSEEPVRNFINQTVHMTNTQIVCSLFESQENWMVEWANPPEAVIIVQGPPCPPPDTCFVQFYTKYKDMMQPIGRVEYEWIKDKSTKLTTVFTNFEGDTRNIEIKEQEPEEGLVVAEGYVHYLHDLYKNAAKITGQKEARGNQKLPVFVQQSYTVLGSHEFKVTTTIDFSNQQLLVSTEVSQGKMNSQATLE